MAMSVPQLCDGHQLGRRGGAGAGVVWRAEVMLSYRRKKAVVCLGSPPINQEFCNTAGKSNALFHFPT